MTNWRRRNRFANDAAAVDDVGFVKSTQIASESVSSRRHGVRETEETNLPNCRQVSPLTWWPACRRLRPENRLGAVLLPGRAADADNDYDDHVIQRDYHPRCTSSATVSRHGRNFRTCYTAGYWLLHVVELLRLP